MMKLNTFDNGKVHSLVTHMSQDCLKLMNLRLILQGKNKITSFINKQPILKGVEFAWKAIGGIN